MYNITINFGGFYNSVHDQYVEWAIESYNSDDQGEMLPKVNDFIYDLSYNEFYLPLYEIYCKDYIMVLNELLNVELKFDSIDSPKFYNFSTDVIIASNFKHSDLFTLKRYIVENDLHNDLKEHLKNITTSRDGYISFYNIDEILSDVELYGMSLLDVIINSLEYEYFTNEFDMIYTYESIGVESTNIIYDKGFENE